MNLTKQNKRIALAAFGLFVLVGCYNAVVINTESHLNGSDAKFVKRLDERNGVTIEGRAIASSWQKLSPSKVMPKQVEAAVAVAPKIENTPVPTAAQIVEEAAAVQDDLTLTLVEVINPKKFEKGLNASQFSGSLASNNGVIESLSVSLPNGEGVSVSFSEMTGNVFEYDMNGEKFTGMMYQVDQHAYMVTLSNGPLEGTRLRFSTETPSVDQQQTQETLAQNHNVEVGNFGEATSEVAYDAALQQETAEAQGFKL
ncbi:hypothetical protein [Peredibacter starrii]|uniref:Uncharacterized protein n=1 Tax=Peredibacter starrii TaxID=28202 RepID=A0AAX4HR56_9BACT|nr:hypothetical protein [Peredibacter starrii]WPU65566.1 hypothetical protein SOO65_02275 [Peredibacter starrii]